MRRIGSGCRAGSLALDVGCLDDRPPLRDFGFLHRGERLGRLLLARRNDKALVNKLLAHGGIVRRANGGGVELVNDVPRPVGDMRVPDADRLRICCSCLAYAK